MVKKDKKQITMSGDDSVKKNKMVIEDDVGRGDFFFNKVVREVLSEEINVIKELRDNDEMSHTGIHLVGSW